MDTRIDKIITDALVEDIPTIDITTDNLFSNEKSEGIFIAKQDGVLSGIMIMKRVFELVDKNVYIKVLNNDGSHVETGDIIAIISGRTASILKGERVALNLMQRMSGIATLTDLFVKEIGKLDTKILDTRKTTPNLRLIEKMAVVHGGGINHRFSLSDQVMIKDNHIKSAGSITKAVEIIKSKVDQHIKIEVEVETFEQFLEAIRTDCDIVMLDNMNNELTRKCVLANNDKLLEASGNMILSRIKGVAETGVDFISVGALTHSYKSMDISLKFNR
ncbi:MAG: carboxylating nicotinate-nucleotide diphosphorylase [Candidatus Izimaplasma sp.]|nr:carboxylating nicotinate-nucleotide diphosphorylase [Candidatus Izimaplasma bacterium]